MKKIRIVLLALGALIPFGGRAQEAAPTTALLPSIKFNIGVKVGANLSKLNGENWDNGYKTNLLGGVFLGVHGSRFGIQAEGLFSQTSYTTGKDFNELYKNYLNPLKDSLQQGTFRVNYFNIPLMAEVRILNRVWLQVGPQYSGIVSIKDKDSFARDAQALFKDGTVSGVAGLWLNITPHLNFGARYVLVFTNDNKTDVSDSWRQRDLQVHLGYNF